MKPSYVGIAGWALIVLSLALVAWAAAGSMIDGRHLLALFCLGLGAGMVARVATWDRGES